MEIDILNLLKENSMLLTFLVIGMGYLIGNIRVGGIEVGASTGVLLIGLWFGHLGMPNLEEAARIGFTLFIFSVGLQAGPGFFGVFLRDGPKYVALALVVAFTAVGLSLGFSALLDLEPGFNAGLLAGALTSTPTLAGADDAVKSGLAMLPEGLTPTQASTNISVGYAITYIFGTAGLIAFINYFPKLLGIDLRSEARQFAAESGLGEKKHKKKPGRDLPVIRAYRIDNPEIVGKTVAEARARRGMRITPLRVRRGDQFLEPGDDLVLESGDVVSAIASLDEQDIAQTELGNEVLDAELLTYQVIAQEVVATHTDVVGHPAGDLDTIGTYGCVITGVERNAIPLAYSDNLVLNKGDRLEVVGEESRVHNLAGRVGHIEQEIEQTDLLTFSLAIAAGVLFGMVAVKIGDISIGLGSAGGLLLTGILVGFLSSLHPTFGRVPAGARFILMDLGLVLFMASVGLKAGVGIADAFGVMGLKLVLAGMVVTLVPVLIAYAFGRQVLKMNPALLLGSVTGAMTSTPSLSIVTKAANSSVPALGYAGTYTFANIFLTFAGTAIMMTG